MTSAALLPLLSRCWYRGYLQRFVLRNASVGNRSLHPHSHHIRECGNDMRGTRQLRLPSYALLRGAVHRAI